MKRCDWGERAAAFYCDDESHDYQPTPEAVEAAEAFIKRREDLEAMREHITEFAKGVFPKFPANGQAKLRQWVHEAFEAGCGCESDDAWEGFKQPKDKALDQFVLMRAIPACIPEIPERALRSDYEPWPYVRISFPRNPARPRRGRPSLSETGNAEKEQAKRSSRSTGRLGRKTMLRS